VEKPFRELTHGSLTVRATTAVQWPSPEDANHVYAGCDANHVGYFLDGVRVTSAAPRAYLISRVALLLLAYVGLRWFPIPLDDGEWRAFPENLWLDGWARFDSGWYWSIVERGYYASEGAQANAAFFPLYPLTVYPLSLIFRPFLTDQQSFFAAGVIVSHVAFAIGLVGLERLGREIVGPAAASRAVWLLALCPFSYFFSAVYTEAFYFALAVWSFHLGRRGHWQAACVLAALCAVVRVPGFLVGVGLCIEYLRRCGAGAFIRRGLLQFWVVPLPVATLLIYFWVELGDPLAFVSAQDAWSRGFAFLTMELRSVIDGESADLTLLYATQLVILPVAIFCSVMAFWRIGAGFGTFALASLLIPAYSGLSALGRYGLVAFPVFLVAGALLRGRRAYVAVLVVSSLLLALFTWWFTNWHLAI
jgi:hypothetical protein